MIRELPGQYVPLTVELAKAHRALPQIGGDRKLLPQNVRVLKEALARGLFHSPTWAVVHFKGTTLRINGKHSSHVLAESNGHFPEGLHVLIKSFTADTEDDLAVLFDQFDHPEGVRSRGQSLQVHKSRIEGLNGISNTSAQYALSGIKWFLSEGATGKFNREDTNQLMHQYADFIKWADAFTGVRRLAKAGVLAAIFATWNVDEDDADTFWKFVREQNHPNIKDGSRVLGKFLEISQYSPTNPVTKTKWDTRAYYVKSIHAWNAWRCGYTTDLKYHPSAPFPAVK